MGTLVLLGSVSHQSPMAFPPFEQYPLPIPGMRSVEATKNDDMEKQAMIKSAVNEMVANGQLATQFKLMMEASMSGCTASQIKNKDTSCINSDVASGQGRGARFLPCICVFGICFPPGCK